ncbi:hypothetical protein HSR121_2742 [Halapricum desulfuricans]|uniref:Uncharacterized protein n=1 Tax=Halapricum desulfuricans TaxID=2841257 RepID=A0A897N281_9EURY|nr:hypothetical protein HSR121_2742 [Halapricum desulfuricans]
MNGLGRTSTDTSQRRTDAAYPAGDASDYVDGESLVVDRGQTNT